LGNPVIGPKLVITGFGETYVMPIRDGNASGALTAGTIPTNWTITCDSGLSSGTPMSLIEYEEVNAGTTGDILDMTGATTLPVNASYLNLNADPFGDISATVTLTPNRADDGDVLRIECWSGYYGGLTKLVEVRVIFTKLTLTLSDDGTANNARPRALGPALDGRLLARVLRGTTGINGVPLLLRSENTLAAAVDKYVFANVDHTTGTFKCSPPGPSPDQKNLVTSTTGPGAGSAQVDVYWQCDSSTINTPEAGVFRVYWDANQNGIPDDNYVQVQQGSGSPIN
jgi:hypothetical protein